MNRPPSPKSCRRTWNLAWLVLVVSAETGFVELWGHSFLRRLTADALRRERERRPAGDSAAGGLLGGSEVEKFRI